MNFTRALISLVINKIRNLYYRFLLDIRESYNLMGIPETRSLLEKFFRPNYHKQKLLLDEEMKADIENENFFQDLFGSSIWPRAIMFIVRKQLKLFYSNDPEFTLESAKVITLTVDQARKLIEILENALDLARKEDGKTKILWLENNLSTCLKFINRKKGA